MLAYSNFSTSEVKTAYTWIDGKPIYKKTIDVAPLPNNTAKNVAHNITDLGSIVQLNGIAYAPDKAQIMALPFMNVGTLGFGVGLQATTTNITVETGFNRSSFTTAYAHIYYTKT